MDAHSEQPSSGKPADSAAGRPLAPFEQLMLVDDRPGHPMCFYLECLVEGPLQENRLREAVATAARRHPLLRSRVGSRGGRPVWLAADVLPAVVWNPASRGGSPWRPFDLCGESGVRIVVLSAGETRHRVVMQVHHAVCDGVAGCEFFGDLWAAYAGAEPRPFSGPRAARPPAAEGEPHEAAAIDAIGGPVDAAWAFATFWPKPLACLTGGRDATKADHRSAAGSRRDPHAPPYEWLDFDPATTERLRLAASSDAVSLNDLLVAAVMRAAVEWNARAGRRPGNVRVTMPVNLRQPGQREPASNHLGYAFLDRTAEECGDAKSLAASIAAATRWILDHDAAAVFLGAIGFLARWPWLLTLTSRIPLCISTVVVSNVGDPSRRMRSGVGRVDGFDAPGDLVIRGVLGVPPLRPRTRAAIGVTTYAGRLSLCCLCSAQPDPHEAAARFLDLVSHELTAMAQKESMPP